MMPVRRDVEMRARNLTSIFTTDNPSLLVSEMVLVLIFALSIVTLFTGAIHLLNYVLFLSFTNGIRVILTEVL
jgi:hypothetical protein